MNPREQIPIDNKALIATQILEEQSDVKLEIIKQILSMQNLDHIEITLNFLTNLI